MIYSIVLQCAWSWLIFFCCRDASYQIFGRLVFGWIDADFCNQILILQHFSRYTGCAHSCTAQTSKLQEKRVTSLVILKTCFFKIAYFFVPLTLIHNCLEASTCLGGNHEAKSISDEKENRNPPTCRRVTGVLFK